jgi:hypothetical protein
MAGFSIFYFPGILSHLVTMAYLWKYVLWPSIPELRLPWTQTKNITYQGVREEWEVP